MKVDITVPSVGESVNEAILAEWYKADGAVVRKDEPLFAIETDKVTLEVVAEADGVLSIAVQEGETVDIGAVVGTLDTEAAPAEAPGTPASEASQPEDAPAAEVPSEAPPVAAVAEAPKRPAEPPKLSPSVRRLIAEKGLQVESITGTGPGGRVTKGDVLTYLEKALAPSAAPTINQVTTTVAVQTVSAAAEDVVRKPLTPIRRRIAERLLAAKHKTAMLTTFNEIDMSATMAIRSRYKEDFNKRYDIGLGFTSFFVKASVQALKEFPAINAFIEENEVVYHNYYHLGIAVGSPKGLVVPIIRHADQLSFADIERAVVGYVDKIKDNKLEISDMEGGTFTITNGGVFGSLLSTPILNTPQSGILGLHKIEKRPVVVDDQIVVRPMMYVAMSYDHRIVDGREAVTFLKRIKECIENPERIMMEV